jgi:hypothetical protein
MTHVCRKNTVESRRSQRGPHQIGFVLQKRSSDFGCRGNSRGEDNHHIPANDRDDTRLALVVVDNPNQGSGWRSLTPGPVWPSWSMKMIPARSSAFWILAIV